MIEGPKPLVGTLAGPTSGESTSAPVQLNDYHFIIFDLCGHLLSEYEASRINCGLDGWTTIPDEPEISFPNPWFVIGSAICIPISSVLLGFPIAHGPDYRCQL